ncbi:MAG: hypothetical protein RPR28_06385 [Cycloclasticus sp.]|jgi:hypothetical protein
MTQKKPFTRKSRRAKFSPEKMMLFDETLKIEYGVKNAAQLAEEFECLPQDIWRRAHILNLTMGDALPLDSDDQTNIYELINGGMSEHHVAVKFNCSVSMVRRVVCVQGKLKCN